MQRVMSNVCRDLICKPALCASNANSKVSPDGECAGRTSTSANWAEPTACHWPSSCQPLSVGVATAFWVLNAIAATAFSWAIWAKQCVALGCGKDNLSAVADKTVLSKNGTQAKRRPICSCNKQTLTQSKSRPPTSSGKCRPHQPKSDIADHKLSSMRAVDWVCARTWDMLLALLKKTSALSTICCCSWVRCKFILKLWVACLSKAQLVPVVWPKPTKCLHRHNGLQSESQWECCLHSSAREPSWPGGHSC